MGKRRKLPAWMTQKVLTESDGQEKGEIQEWTGSGEHSEISSVAPRPVFDGPKTARRSPLATVEQGPLGNQSVSGNSDTIEGLTFPGCIKYCSTIDDMGMACEELISYTFEKDEMILGFDAEWPINYQNGSGKIALIQVCPNEKTCYLFHVSRMGSLPKIFVDLIKHPKVKLVGNCIKNDLWKLGKDFNIQVSKLVESDQVIDLGKFANKVLRCAQTWSLERLALHLMSVKIDKKDTIRKSKWNLALAAEQQLYAATDAYVSLMIYNILMEKQSLSL